MAGRPGRASDDVGLRADDSAPQVFTESTHIVAIKTTGNVFSYQAVEELNIRPKNWKCVAAGVPLHSASGPLMSLRVPAGRDLLTDEPFTRKDILVIQDPLNLSGRTLDQFDHVRNQLSATDQAQQSRGANVNAALSGDMARALKHLDTDAARAGTCMRHQCAAWRTKSPAAAS